MLFSFQHFAMKGFPWIVLAAFLISACNPSIEIPGEIDAAIAALPENPDYNRHIKPILSDRCFKCHGPDRSKIEGGLQLVSLDGATQVLESGNRAVVPGNVPRSELVRRILSSDPGEMMPPPDSHLSLTDQEKALLIQWVKKGAAYSEHWSLSPITEPKIPRAGKNWIARWGLRRDEDSRWVKNEIDQFVIRAMRENGMKPAGEAERLQLLRRVYMDLTGLPPSADEVESYMKDTTSGAYEREVDKLLESPHYGEHMTVSWLDLARYADSHGYQDDGMRNAYPYRDWVIRAFNQNLAFDKFITWQLAGDLLPDPTPDMLTATSFNRQHPQTQEGGVVAEEYQVEYVADRVNTFGKAFLGITMECARCHDHKYDPISTKDYYSMFAFFNQNKEYGEVPYSGEASPTLMLPEPETEKKIRFIRERIASAEKQKDDKTRYAEGFTRFLASRITNDEAILRKNLLAKLSFESSDQDKYVNEAGAIRAVASGDKDRLPLPCDGRSGRGIEFRGDCGIKLLGPSDEKAKRTPDRFYRDLNLERNQAFSVSLWINLKKPDTSGPLITKNNGEFEGYRGYDLFLNRDQTITVRMMHVYPANGIELKTTEKITAGKWTNIALTWDASGRAGGLQLFIDGRPASVKILTDNLVKSILHGRKQENWSFMPFEIGKNFLTTLENVQMDELRFYNRKLTRLEIESLSRNEETVAFSEDREKLYEFYLWNVDEKFRATQEELSTLRLEEVKTINDVEEVMIMEELPADQQRKTFVLARGAYDSPEEEVFAETPEKLGRLPSEYPRNRLGLALWLIDERNPLFARVMANRFWLQFFGRGLVKTQEDFGNQGEMPTHPELLDWLAVQFRKDGWDTKKFIRRIVTSAAYRQSSRVSPEDIERDPENLWLSRGPSHAYSAEQVRDHALAASGLLVKKVGGPSVYPYQPSGLWEALATRNAVTYKQHHGDSLYRRSMYTVIKRSSPPPMMLNFDAPDRQLCSVRRQRTATPLQALVTLNDPQFVEAARVLAERALMRKSSMKERIHFMFMSCISRPPLDQEEETITALVQEQIGYYAGKPLLALQLANAGEFPAKGELKPVETAAYTIAAQVIMNHDEVLMKR